MTKRSDLPSVSIIIVNYNGMQFLQGCLDSLLRLNYPQGRIETIMVDNSSSDGSCAFVRQGYPHVKLIVNDVNNYCLANNLGLRMAKGDFVAFINNDVRVDPDWLIGLVDCARQDPKIGAVGSKILFDDGTVQSVGHQEYPNFYWGDIGFKDADAGQYEMLQEVVSICGTSVLYRRACLEDIGFFDDDFMMFLEDVDMGIRCRKKGWKLLVCPASRLVHKLHGSIQTEERAKFWQERNRLLLVAKHWPEKLADALAGKEFFTVKAGIDALRDIGEIMGMVLYKVLKEHGRPVYDKVSPPVFASLRRIYGFEKDHLIQLVRVKQAEADEQRRAVGESTQKNNELLSRLEAQAQEAEVSRQRNEADRIAFEKAKKQEIDFLLQHKNQEIEHLAQSKDQEIARVREEGASALAAFQKAKTQEIDYLLKQKTQEIDSLLKQKNLEIEHLVKDKDREICLLRRQQEAVSDSMKKEHDQALRSIVEDYDARIRDLQDRVSGLQKERDDIQVDVSILQEKLNSIYASTGYRLVLRPLWDVLWQIKRYGKSFKSMAAYGIKWCGWKAAALTHKKTDQGQHVQFYHKPKDIHIQITDRCNLQCRHCDIWKKKPIGPELNTQEWKEVIERLHHWLGGGFNVHFCGGEPFIRNDLLELVGYCAAKNIRTFVTTNFTLIDAAMVRLIAESGMTNLNLSLDAVDAEKSVFLRSRQDCFERLVKLLEEFRKYPRRPRITIASILMGYNAEEIKKIVSLLHDRTLFDGMNVQPLYQNFSAEYDPRWYRKSELWPKDSRSMAAMIDYLAGIKAQEDIIDNHAVHLQRMKEYFRCPEEYARRYACAVGFNNMNINPDGSVLLCWNMDPVGDLRRDYPEKIWLSETAQERRRQITQCRKPCSILNCNYTKRQDTRDFQVLIRPHRELAEKPRGLIFTVTTKCNFHCRHCDMPLIRDQRPELQTDDIKRLIADLYSWLGGFYIELTGGEPLLREDIFEIIRCASSLNGVWIQMSSNGSLIDEGRARQIVDSGLKSLGLSFDAMDPAIHDYIKNRPGAHQKAIETINVLNAVRGLRMRLSLQSIITSINLEQLEKVVSFARQNRLNAVSFQPIFQKFGTPLDATWFRRNELWPRDAALVDSTLEGLIRLKNADTPDSWIVNSAAYLRRLKRYFRDPNKRLLRQCHAERNIFLTPCGDVMLCPSSKPIGNILEKNIREILTSEPARETREFIRRCRSNCSLMMCIYDE